MLRGLEIVQADESNLEAASEILIEAARWLLSRGDPLWQPEDLSAQALRPQALDGTLHLGRLRGEPVATIVLQFEDRLFWPDEARADAAFFHRLAVRRRVAGSGVAPALIAWAEQRAREAGRSWLRLDCSARHPGLAAYYEGLGFERHSEGRIGPWSFLRYQKRV